MSEWEEIKQRLDAQDESLCRLIESLRDRPPPALAEKFLFNCLMPTDINEHLGTLWGLARQCNHVTEFGVRSGVSTSALLVAQPAVLVCYDKVACPIVNELQDMCGRTDFRFHVQDSRQCEIELTDFLFIDTVHAYSCLSVELKLHAPKVRRFIAMHDTELFGHTGDDGGEGMHKAIHELCATGKWTVFGQWMHNSGLTVMRRVKEESI